MIHNTVERRKRVRAIKAIYGNDSFLPALSYSDSFCRAGDLFIYQLVLEETNSRFGLRGAGLSVLLACNEIEVKTGILTPKAFQPVLTYRYSYTVIERLRVGGLLAPAPFPLQFSHIKRICKCYTVTDKGREAIEFFYSEYKRHLKEAKKGKLRKADSFGE